MLDNTNYDIPNSYDGIYAQRSQKNKPNSSALSMHMNACVYAHWRKMTISFTAVSLV